jgi:hypothetical protein
MHNIRWPAASFSWGDRASPWVYGGFVEVHCKGRKRHHRSRGEEDHDVMTMNIGNTYDRANRRMGIVHESVTVHPRYESLP